MTAKSIGFSITAEEYEIIAKAAAREHRTITSYARDKVLQHAESVVL